MNGSARVLIPRTQLSVSRLCLGGNRLGGALDKDASFALLDAWVGQGANFIDTAHVYADWLPDVERSCSEKTLGRWLKARGGSVDVVIATKGGHPRGGDPRARLDRATVRQDVAEALDYLGLARLDLFYLHRDDPALPVEDVLGVVEELRREGQVRHYACSNWSGARMRAAEEAARRNGWEGFVAHQPEWSLARRNPGTSSPDLLAMDADMRSFHEESGLPVIPYSSQAKGYFDKIGAAALDDITARAYDNAANRATAARLAEIAARHGATPTQVMLNAMMHSPFLTIPVVGCRTAEQIASSLASVGLDLTDAERRELLSL
ncbi:aldo/keto reductase [Alsobacter sp. SYSU M60028]|uniref:Aldo/keto reductase n=1 Tax=Alsobacter ponti TaxID=2962936 RepID=A0ABT1LBI2_9HYPH|nr:aldo/keto reductase [Alsobacter ponti]MCP8938413.1 aldo/keto reductase [Alsobacter ponti]